MPQPEYDQLRVTECPVRKGEKKKPKLDKVTEMAKQLGIPMTPDLMQLGTPRQAETIEQEGRKEADTRN